MICDLICDFSQTAIPARTGGPVRAMNTSSSVGFPERHRSAADRRRLRPARATSAVTGGRPAAARCLRRPGHPNWNCSVDRRAQSCVRSVGLDCQAVAPHACCAGLSGESKAARRPSCRIARRSTFSASSSRCVVSSHCDPVLLANLPQVGPQVVAGGRVQARAGLVHQQHAADGAASPWPTRRGGAARPKAPRPVRRRAGGQSEPLRATPHERSGQCDRPDRPYR